MSHAGPLDPQYRTIQEAKDREHLTLLAVFHYVTGLMTTLFSCCGVMYVGFGLVMLFAPDMFQNSARPTPTSAPPVAAGIMMVAFGGVGGAVLIAMSAMVVFSGRSIQLRKRRILSLIVAALLCMNFPFGTALGVCTIIVLSRESVRLLYESAQT